MKQMRPSRAGSPSSFGTRHWPIGAVAATLALAACEEPNTYVAPPPPKVTIAEPVLAEVTDYLEFTGTTESSAQVDVRARVPGILESMSFEPGTEVEEGQSLFVIDRDVYQAEVQRAEASLAQAEASSELADATLARVQQAGDAVSQTQVEEAAAEARNAAAEILARKAELRQAEIDLEYTDVIAPISGRVGRNRVDIGNLVGAGEPTVLTEITAFDPIYVYFNMNERDLLHVLDMVKQRLSEKGYDPDADATEQAELPVQLGLADEEGFPHEGLLDFAESGVDPETGTLRLRAIFENKSTPPDLLPGLFARVRMPIAQRQDMPLVTERAISSDQSGRYVLVVNDDNIVEKRNVRLGQLIDGLSVIEEGVGGGDRVVVNGLQRARPEAAVDPEAVDMASFKTSSPTAEPPAADEGGAAASDEDAQPETPAESEEAAQAEEAETPEQDSQAQSN
ncbi:MAG: efflux RND transporter periplasmic adaptor subunit [Pseudomonadota bacterium]